MGDKHYQYSNIEYFQMVHLYAKAKGNAREARRQYAAPENMKLLNNRGVISPQVPTEQAIQAVNQRLIDYGQFRTPSHAIGRGNNRKKVCEEDVADYFKSYPRKSTRDAARHFGVSNYYVWNALREIKDASPVATVAARSSSDEGDSDSDGLIDDPSDITDFLVFNQAAPSTSTTEQQPSTSAAEELQYQPSRYSIVSGNENALVEEIVIKEEITDEERNQCRLCLSVGRRMQELGEYAPLYRKLLFENNYQHTTIPSFMFSMLACWECIAELRRIKRFQEKVRRANTAFETNQNQKCENLSNLSTILIGDYKNSNAGDSRPTSIEDCAQDIKEEAVEAEVEETCLPDPLAVEQDVKTTRQDSEIYLEIEHEPNTSITPKKVVKRPISQPKPSQRQPKRTKLDQNVANAEPMRAELDQSGSKTTQEEEDFPKSVAEVDCDAIFGKVKVEIDELEKILTERRNKESFKSMKFKCDSCVLGFTDHSRLLEHNRNFHDEEVGSCECDICERRFDDDSQLSAHYRNHFVKFVCKLCNFECYTKTGRTIHFKRHKGALQGTSLEALLRKKLASEQRVSVGGSSRQTST